MPASTHVCPKCSDESPCFFSEGEIVSLREDAVSNEPLALWTGIVLEVERDKEGRVYRVLWGAPAPSAPASGAATARHTGEHRHEELRRFLVPPIGPRPELGRGGGGGKEPMSHRFEPAAP